jgi:hypothetical protein
MRSDATGKLAILNEDVQTLLDGQRRIEDNQTETERKDIITRADFEEIANCALPHPCVSKSPNRIAPW